MIESDWTRPLQNYIASVYGPGDHFSEEIAALNRLRQDVRGAGMDGIGRDLIYRYYGQLELLDLRVPVGEGGCRMSFTWQDSFSHESSTQYSLAFEKASLLFNLATVNSKIAVDTDDIRIGYNRFQDAAGIYHYIMENFLHAPSVDLSQDTVKSLSKLMLAQAQEVFLEKLVQGSGKPSMMAKIAKGAANFYKSAGDSLQAEFNDKSWGERHWYQYALCKAKYFVAVASEYHSDHLDASGKHGEAIAYLINASSALQDLVRSSQIPPIYIDFTNLVKSRAESVKIKLAALEKDNDFIYHDHVPPAATLAEITGLEAAKPTPLNQLYQKGDMSQIIGRDIFENLIPLSVHEKSSMYSEEKANLLRKEGEKVEVADEEFSSALEFLDLPAALSLVKGNSSGKQQALDESVPGIVNGWASEVLSKSDQSMQALESCRASVYSKLKDAEHKLQQEEKDYNEKKQRFGSRLDQVSSLSLTSGISTDIQRVKSSLATGASSDEKIKAMVSRHQSDIDVLARGPDNSQLTAKFRQMAQPQQAANQQMNLLDLDTFEDESVKEWIEESEELLSKLNKISKERKTIFMEFKDKVHKDDISSLLILNGKVPNIEEQLFKTELEKFHPYQTRIDATIHHQNQMLKTLTATWKKVLSNNTVKQKTSSRENHVAQRNSLIESLRGAYEAWKESQDGISVGKKFYADLDATATRILNNANELVRNRQEERNKLLQEIPNNSQEALRQQLYDLSISTPSPPPAQSSQYQYQQPPLPPQPQHQQQPYQSPPPQQYQSPPPQHYQSPPPQQYQSPPPQQYQQQQFPPGWANPPPVPSKPTGYSFQQQPSQHTTQAPQSSEAYQGYQAPQAPQSSQAPQGGPYSQPSVYEPSLYGPPQGVPYKPQYSYQPPSGNNNKNNNNNNQWR
ncbi:vacuolar-sorting protein Bro1p [Trichomonascus vanleenenianus]|uniref:Bro1p n=1 Tax=Trichomonascus vanleenenianus TaxID=2268995 RepID=UPI003ECAF0AF